MDASHGWEAVAEEFMPLRSSTGLTVVQKWAASLARGGRVLDAGAGSGEPLAAALKPGGRLLFTAPRKVCVWDDLLTGRPSISLGAEAYRLIMTDSGLYLAGEHIDESDNHYYEAYKPSAR